MAEAWGEFKKKNDDDKKGAGEMKRYFETLIDKLLAERAKMNEQLAVLRSNFDIYGEAFFKSQHNVPPELLGSWKDLPESIAELNRRIEIYEACISTLLLMKDGKPITEAEFKRLSEIPVLSKDPKIPFYPLIAIPDEKKPSM